MVGHKNKLVFGLVQSKADLLFVAHRATQKRPGKRAHDVPLHNAVQRTRAKGGVVAHVAEPRLALVVNIQGDFPVHEPLGKLIGGREVENSGLQRG